MLPPAEGVSPTQARAILGPVDLTPFTTSATLMMPNTAGMAFHGTAPTGHSINIDVDEETGGTNTGPEPKPLLLLALGSCTGMDVISILRKKRQTVSEYNIHIYASEAQEHPKVYTSILVEHIFTGEGVLENAVARAIELSITKYCPVHLLLCRVVPIEHVYRIINA